MPGRSWMLSVSLGRTAARKTKDETFYGKRWFYPRTRALVLPFHVRMKINWCAVGYYSHRILSITLLAINSVGNERVKYASYREFETRNTRLARLGRNQQGRYLWQRSTLTNSPSDIPIDSIYRSSQFIFGTRNTHCVQSLRRLRKSVRWLTVSQASLS